MNGRGQKGTEPSADGLEVRFEDSEQAQCSSVMLCLTSLSLSLSVVSTCKCSYTSKLMD